MNLDEEILARELQALYERREKPEDPGVSTEYLAKEWQCSQKAVRKRLNYLMDKGWLERGFIERINLAGQRFQKPVYRIKPEIAIRLLKND